MSNFYHCLILVLLASIPVTSYAMKPPKSGNVVISLKNGQPCFSYPQDKEILKKKTYAFGYLDVLDDHHRGGWEIGLSDPFRKGLLDPNTPATCIKYGVPNPGMNATRTAEPLRFDTPYQVRLDVLTSWEKEGQNECNYVSDFCLTHNTKGETILVGAEWDDKAGAMKCLKPGESKRGFWQKLFGK